MKGYKVGQTYFWQGYGMIVVVGSYPKFIDVMLVNPAKECGYSRGTLRFYISAPQIYGWKKTNGLHYEVIAGGRRPTDGYRHYAVLLGGKKLVSVSAGCRKFPTVEEALKHWKLDLQRCEWPYDRRHPEYKSAHAKHRRVQDRKRNVFSRAFVRKVERVLAKNKK